MTILAQMPVKRIWIVLLAWIILFTAGDVWAQDGEMSEEIGIGVFLPLSGSNTVFGRIQLNSYLLAVDEINSQGGIDGVPVALDIRYTAGKAQNMKGIIESFVKVKNHAVVIGGIDTAVSEKAAVNSQKLSIPYIAVSPSGESLTTKGYGNVFRIASPVSVHPSGSLDLIARTVRPSRVAVVMERTDYGDSMLKAVSSRAQAEGWKVNSTVQYEFGTTDFDHVSDEALEGAPDVIFMVAFGRDAADLVSALKKGNGKSPVLVGLTPAFTTKAFRDRVGSLGDDILASTLWSSYHHDDAEMSFLEAYRERYGSDPDYHGAQAHAAVYIAVEALKRSITMEPQDVRTALETIRIQTAYGMVSFTQWKNYTNQNRPPSYVIQWQEGIPELVWPHELRTSERIIMGSSDLLPRLFPRTSAWNPRSGL